MFRRIVNWFKERLVATEVSAEAGYRSMLGGPFGIDTSGSYLFHDGEAAMEFALRECFRTGKMVFVEVVSEPLVELTATETKVEQWIRLSRNSYLEDLSTNDRRLAHAARLVVRDGMSEIELEDLQERIENGALSSKPPN